MPHAYASRDDIQASEHIEQILGAAPSQPYVGIVLYKGSRRVGSVLINGWGHGNCFLTAVLTGPVTVTQARYVFRYCFETLDCQRITATTHVLNGSAIHAMRRLGFKYEGILKGYYSGKDAAVFGLLRNEQKIVRL